MKLSVMRTLHSSTIGCLILFICLFSCSEAEPQGNHGCSLADFSRPAAGGTGTGQVPFTFLKALPGVKENLSGIAYYPAYDTLMVVRNKPPALFEVSLEGKILKTIKLEGFDDTEGITHVEGSRFAITEETKSKIHIVDIPLAGGVIKLKDVVSTINVKLPHPVKHNKGLEGLAYDSNADVFYTVTEKDPMSVLRVYRNGTVVSIWNEHSYQASIQVIVQLKCAAQNLFSMTSVLDAMHNISSPLHPKKTYARKLQECLLQTKLPVGMHASPATGCLTIDNNCNTAGEWTITDMAGIYFRRGQEGVEDRLLVLTEEGKALFAMDTSGHVLERMPVGGKQPEGVVLLPNGRDLFIASEPDQLLRYTCTATIATVQEEGFHALLENFYNVTLSAGQSLYYGLKGEDALARVEAYLGNATVNSVLADVNATLAKYVPEVMQSQAGVAAFDVMVLLLGLSILYCVMMCLVRCAMMSRNGVTRCIMRCCFCCRDKRGGKAGAPAYQHMETYDDVELGLELGELEGLVHDDGDVKLH